MMNEESTTPSRNPVSLFFQRLSQVCTGQFSDLPIKHVFEG